jgi:hypothetical protein
VAHGLGRFDFGLQSVFRGFFVALSSLLSHHLFDVSLALPARIEIFDLALASQPDAAPFNLDFIAGEKAVTPKFVALVNFVDERWHAFVSRYA